LVGKLFDGGHRSPLWDASEDVELVVKVQRRRDGGDGRLEIADQVVPIRYSGGWNVKDVPCLEILLRAPQSLIDDEVDVRRDDLGLLGVAAEDARVRQIGGLR